MKIYSQYVIQPPVRRHGLHREKRDMRYYFAPLEGITGYVYRSIHHKHFPGVDRYYMPFIAPNYTMHLKQKEKQDVDPANNQGLAAVPQILSNKADETLWAVEELSDRGYKEINLNLGCPMPTVARKKKGSGLLKYTDELDAYLDGVYNGLAKRQGECPPVRLSIKTRLGTDSTDEAERLVQIYNRYPVSELIVHPRCQADLYRGVPDREAFLLVLRESTNPVVYNGDLCCSEDVREIERACREALLCETPPGEAEGSETPPGETKGSEIPRDEGKHSIDSVMIGRGLLADPSLVRQCQGGVKVTAQELGAFHDDLYRCYKEILPGHKVVLNRMKELWSYMGKLFPEGAKCLKEIRKAGTEAQYEAAVRVLLSTCRVQ